MTRIDHTSGGENLIAILFSISLGLALIIFSSGRTNAYNNEIVPVVRSISSRIKVQQIYTSQIGVREKGTNAGTDVEKYLRYVNLPKGNPWCAAFVCWVYGRAGVGNPRTGWSPALFGEGRVIWGRGVSGIKYQEPRSVGITPKVIPSSPLNGKGLCAQCPPLAGVGGGMLVNKNMTPTTGDIFGLYFSEKKRIAHVGFIDQWDDTWMISVEGNTNVSGSREGDGVYRKRRLVKTVYKVSRYVE